MRFLALNAIFWGQLSNGIVSGRIDEISFLRVLGLPPYERTSCIGKRLFVRLFANKSNLKSKKVIPPFNRERKYYPREFLFFAGRLKREAMFVSNF